MKKIKIKIVRELQGLAVGTILESSSIDSAKRLIARGDAEEVKDAVAEIVAEAVAEKPKK